MVIYALLETNVRDVVLDPVVDKIHRVKYRNDRDGNHVILKDNGGRDHIITAGRLALLDVQCPENPVVAAFGGSLFTGEYQRAVPPRADEFHRFSTLFELERLAIDAVEVHGLAELNADGTRSILPDQKYFQEQKTAVDGFIAAYAHAVESSNFGKPTLERFYDAMRDLNKMYVGRGMGMSAYQNSDFERAFGKTLFDKLKDVLGEP